MKPLKPLLPVSLATLLILAFLIPSSLHAERRRDHVKTDCYKITGEWLNNRNKAIPANVKILCDKYAAELNQDIDGFNPMDGLGLFGEGLAMTNFDPESDAFLKSIPLSEASKLGIPLQITSKIGSASQKLKYLRSLAFQTRTLIIADYSYQTAGDKPADASETGLDLGTGSAAATPGQNPAPAAAKPEGRYIAWSNSLDIYLQDKSGVRKIFHEDRAECQAHLFRTDDKSPVFVQIKLSGSGSGNTGFLYLLGPNGSFEEKLAFGGLRGGYLAVQNYKAEGNMVIDVKQTKEDFNLTENQRDDCPSFVAPTIFEMFMYKWDGKQFQKLCKYYYESNE